MKLIDADNFMGFITALEEAGAESVSFDDLRKFIWEQFTAFDLESVIAELEERLKQLREEQSEDCKKHDGYWTPEQGVRGGTIKAYLEILEVLKSAANAMNGKSGE